MRRPNTREEWSDIGCQTAAHGHGSDMQYEAGARWQPAPRSQVKEHWSYGQ